MFPVCLCLLKYHHGWLVGWLPASVADGARNLAATWVMSGVNSPHCSGSQFIFGTSIDSSLLKKDYWTYLTAQCKQQHAM